MIQEIKHIDGVWKTTEYPYRDRIIVIKSQKNHGMKAHCFYEGKVIFTQRFRSILPALLLKRMKDRIDSWIEGAWTPKKLLKTK